MFHCTSPISLPTLHRNTDGWFRSRTTKLRMLRWANASKSVSSVIPAFRSYLSNASLKTSSPMLSARASTSGASTLWLVRMAFTPMAFMISSCRRSAAG